jgi:hypothetical protein
MVGAVSPATNMMAEMFSRIDSNKDGVLTKEEMKADFEKMQASMPFQKKGPSFDEIFAKIDTNGDGKVTEEELKAFGPKHKPHHGGSQVDSALQEQLLKSMLLKESELLGSVSNTSTTSLV